MTKEKVEFSKEDREFFESTRATQPAVDQLFKDIRSLMEEFAGSHITYLQVGQREWGVKSKEGVIPHITLSVLQIQKRMPKPTTQNAKRRAITKYKE